VPMKVVYRNLAPKNASKVFIQTIENKWVERKIDIVPGILLTKENKLSDYLEIL